MLCIALDCVSSVCSETCNEAWLHKKKKSKESEVKIMSYKNFDTPCGNCYEQGDNVEMYAVTVTDTGADLDIYLCGRCATGQYMQDEA
jgi:hypothetical protein